MRWLSWSALALLVAAGRAGADAPGPVLAQFDIPRDGDVLLVPLELEGKPYPFLLDTGSARTIFDVSLRPLLRGPGVDIAVKTANRDISVPTFRAPAARLGPLALPAGLDVGVMDLGEIRATVGYPVSGILGMDVLGRYVLQLDFERGKVLFLSSPGPDAGRAMTLSRREGLAFVPGRLPGRDRPEPFLVDTGCGGYGSGDLRADLFASLVLAGKVRPENEGLFVAASGTGREPRGNLAALAVGDFCHRDLVFASSGTLNALGLGYWSRYVVTFDFPGQVLYLRQGPRFNDPDLLDRSGLHLLRQEGKIVVVSVDGGSPADRGGVRPRDELLRVDGVAAAECRLFALRRFLCEEGKTVPLVLRRGREELTVPLPLTAWWRVAQTSLAGPDSTAPARPGQL